MPTKRAPQPSKPSKIRRLHEIIRDKSLLEGKEFVLASGQVSKYYFNMKTTTFDPEGASLISELMYDAIASESVSYVGGLANGAIPIVSNICLYSAAHIPIQGFYVREEIKNHGTQQLIEGLLEDNANVVIVDDVTTKGTSVMKAVDAVRQRGCSVVKIITIVDRLEGALGTFQDAGIDFMALFTTKDFP